MATEKQSTGSGVLDNLLNGGFEKDVVTTIYGPAGSGKTNICLIAAVRTAESGKRVIYIDTEGGFSIERVKQLTDDHKGVLDNIIILKPTNFEEQRDVFSKLNKIITADVGLIVIDTISMLYRLELGKSEDVYLINRELGQQLAFMTEITRKKCIPVVITNQVYANFEERDKVNMVGGDILKYGSKCLIELSRTESIRTASLRKHRSIAEGKEIRFKITDKSLVEA